MCDDFTNFGYVIVKNLFSDKEVEKIVKSVENSPEMLDAALKVKDYAQKDKDNHLLFIQWCDPPKNDLVSLVIRNRKVAQVAEKLLNRGEIYLYNARVWKKPEFCGSVIMWHQDYHYYTTAGCIYPDIINCYVALSKNDHENGGLKVMKASHRCGLAAHIPFPPQEAVDPNRVALLEKKLSVENVDLATGDAIFMHCNTVHMSPPNDSAYPRWGFSMNFNTKFNSPDVQHRNACYTEKLEFVPVDSVETCDNLNLDTTRRYMKFTDHPTHNKYAKQMGIEVEQ